MRESSKVLIEYVSLFQIEIPWTAMDWLEILEISKMDQDLNALVNIENKQNQN